MGSEKNKMKTRDTPSSDAAEYHQYDAEPPLPLGSHLTFFLDFVGFWLQTTEPT